MAGRGVRASAGSVTSRVAAVAARRSEVDRSDEDRHPPAPVRPRREPGRDHATAPSAPRSSGFADVWVSDHIIVPAAQDYPSPYLFDPLMSLAWAAAATTTIGLGTSVLVAPQYHPLWLANTLASLDALSGGRAHRGGGRRLVGGRVRRARTSRSTTAAGAPTRSSTRCACAGATTRRRSQGEFYGFDDIRLLPKPAHDIPIWVGGSADATYRRAVDARRRLPRHRPRHRRRARAGRTRPPRPARRVVHHLAAHGLGPPGHGPRPHPP